MSCPYCHRINAVEAVRCAYCGAVINSASPAPAAGNPFSDQPANPFTEQEVAYAEVVPPNITDDPTLRYLIPIGRSIHAIIAGYLGLLSLGFCFLGPFAVLFGILAILDIKKNPKKTGMVRAIVGIGLGLLGSTVLVFAVIGFIAEGGGR